MFIAALFIKVMNYETVQMFVTRRMDNQIPLYGILLSNKKKKQTTDWINIDESQRHAKWKKPVTKKALFCDWIYMKSKYKQN